MNKEINLNDKLGKVQKPSVENILGKKKVYVCILIQAPLEAPKELHDIIQKYWDAVEINLSNLEKKAGVINKIFVEGIPGKGEDVLMGVKEASLGAWQIAEIRTKSGAIFEQLEDKEILLKVVDWSKCLNVGLMSQQVADTITNELKEESEKRFNYIKNSLNNNIDEGESALIFTGNQDIQIPENIEKFIISPPELDMVAQWIKNAQQQMEEKIRNQYNTQQDKEKKDESDKTDSGLWTPN